MLFRKSVLVARNKLPAYSNAISNSFFSTVSTMGVCKSCLFKKV